MTLHLVRHAAPVAVPSTAQATWELSTAGAAAAADLCRHLPPAHLVASEEPKAWQTLASVGAARRDGRLGEVRRDEPWDDGFVARRRAYVSGVRQDGWELQEAVAARFGEAVRKHERLAGGRPLVVASHGMSMTVWLVAAGVVDAAGAGDFWKALRLPDCWRVDLSARGLVRCEF